MCAVLSGDIEDTSDGGSNSIVFEVVNPSETGVQYGSASVTYQSEQPASGMSLWHLSGTTRRTVNVERDHVPLTEFAVNTLNALDYLPSRDRLALGCLDYDTDDEGTKPAPATVGKQ